MIARIKWTLSTSIIAIFFASILQSCGVPAPVQRINQPQGIVRNNDAERERESCFTADSCGNQGRDPNRKPEESKDPNARDPIDADPSVRCKEIVKKSLLVPHECCLAASHSFNSYHCGNFDLGSCTVSRCSVK